MHWPAHWDFLLLSEILVEPMRSTSVALGSLHRWVLCPRRKALNQTRLGPGHQDIITMAIIEIPRENTDIEIEAGAETSARMERETVMARGRETDVATGHQGVRSRQATIVRGMIEKTDAFIIMVGEKETAVVRGTHTNPESRVHIEWIEGETEVTA